MRRAPLRGWSFRLVLATSFTGFSGYALLLPVVPLWASLGGSGEFGAGATTGVLMVATVGTQFVVPVLLRRIGHRAVLALGMVLLGAPAPLYALSAGLPLLLAVSLLRGIGFGLATGAGSALTAELVPPAEHGRASARYGVAAGLPQLALLPAGVLVAQQVGFAPLFALAGALPLVGALLVLGIQLPRSGVRVRPESLGTPGTPATPAGPGTPAGSGQDLRAVRGSAGPWLAMLSCSIAHGGVITFLPLALPRTGTTVPLALLALAACALLGRLLAGELGDRHARTGRLLGVGIGLAAAGMIAEVAAVQDLTGSPSAVAVAGSALVGMGFGLVQNDSLVMMFALAGPPGYGAASAAWNIAYDAGTGLGAGALGAVAQPLGFPAAFGTSAALLLAAGLSVAGLSAHRAGLPRAQPDGPRDRPGQPWR